jgi:hypothetical protein
MGNQNKPHYIAKYQTLFPRGCANHSELLSYCQDMDASIVLSRLREIERLDELGSEVQDSN